MKNVRLFAVAAALGMFASTVAAADTKANVTWSTEDAVIKVDLGDSVILPTVTASYSLKDAKHETGSYYGLVDAGSWYHTSAKLWTSTEDAVKDLGLGGLRYLAPGAAENEGSYVDANGTVYADYEEAYAALLKDGKITEVKNSEDDVTTIVLNFTDKKNDEKKPTKLTQNYLTVGTGRKDYDNAKEAIVNYLVDGSETGAKLKATETPYYTNAYTPKTYWVNKDIELEEGTIVFVQYNKRGEGTVVAVAPFANKNSKDAAAAVTAADLELVGGTNVNTEFATKTYDALTAGVTYFMTYTVGEDTATKKFTKSDVQFLTSDTYKAYNTEYRFTKGTNDTDVSALVFIDVNGNKNVVKLSDSDLKYLDAETSTWKAAKSLDLTNATVLAKVLDGTTKLSYDGVALVACVDADTNPKNLKNSFEYAFLAPATYDYVVSNKGYNKVSASMAKALGDNKVGFTIDGGKTIVASDISASTATLKKSAAADWNYISALGSADKITVVEVDKNFDAEVYFNNKTTVGKIAVYSEVEPGVDPATAGTTAAPAQVKAGKTVYVVSGSTATEKAAGSELTTTTGLYRAEGTTVNITDDANKNPSAAIVSGAKYLEVGGTTVITASTAVGTTETATEFTQGKSYKLLEAAEVGTDYSAAVEATDGTPAHDNNTNKAAREEDASKAFSITPEYGKKGDLATKFVLDENVQNFVEVLAPTTDDGVVVDMPAHSLGMYYVEAPQNKTEFYVLLTGTEVGGVDPTELSWSRSTSKMKGYYDDKDGNEVETELAYLDKTYYPAFNTLEELEKFVARMSGLDTALVGSTKSADSTKSFAKWYAKNADAYKTLTGEEAPTSATYDLEKLAEGETKTATVTSDVDSIDFKTAGVKAVTYTAKDADGNELDTNKITVVVAPKYTRTWENGRVKTLKSYYVSNPSQVYADYTYNWSAKTVTYTYYNEDGSVASQGTNNLD